MVSVLAASQGNPGIALGNAYGSNITNIALILGVTALISPIAVHSQVLSKELSILTVVTGLAHGNSGMARSLGSMLSCCWPCSES